jgi:small subunit ribosomal protein S9
LIPEEQRPDEEGDETGAAPEGSEEPFEGAEPAADPGEAPTTGAEDGAESAPGEDAGESAPGEDAADSAPAEDSPTADEGPAEEAAAGDDAPEPEEAPAAAEAPAPEGAADTPEDAAPAPEDAADAAEAMGGEAGEPKPAQERRPRKPGDAKEAKEEVVPGAHLEPDLVLEEQKADDDQYAAYAQDDGEPGEAEPAGDGAAPAAEEGARTPLEMAADARYQATGKRKTSVARVILKPGSGTYLVNGRELNQYFPRPRLQHAARQPLEATGNESRMDVVARIHGGGVSAQAGALRHGIARALVEADPNLRAELKRHGFLTRDARAKERKKAGLKKARKRPQFSKR